MGSFSILMFDDKWSIFPNLILFKWALGLKLENRTGSELVKTTTNTHEYLTARAYKPNHQILDNKAFFVAAFVVFIKIS